MSCSGCVRGDDAGPEMEIKIFLGPSRAGQALGYITQRTGGDDVSDNISWNYSEQHQWVSCGPAYGSAVRGDTW